MTEPAGMTRRRDLRTVLVQTIGRPGKAAGGRIEHIGAETGSFPLLRCPNASPDPCR